MHQAHIDAICLVKNEDDVIAQSLLFATQYCDRIFVIDNGSTDDTWTIVNDLARQNPVIVPFEQTLSPYGDWLRARVFNEIHSKRPDDHWWMILDADEFFAEDPRVAIDAAVRQRADLITTWQIQFYFTDRDLHAWTEGKDCREEPIVSRRRYYQINWQEPRLFRNRSQRRWDTQASIKVPDGLSRTSSYRPLNRHYQFRDPEQMNKRVTLRYGHPLFPHVQSAEWRAHIRDSRSLKFHRDDDAWHFSASGLARFYRKTAYHRLLAACHGGALRRARRILASK
jgi:glycosyltransferase involved in cell wall biosynthesis